MLKFEETIENGEHIFSLEGDLDTTTEKEFYSKMLEKLKEPNAKKFVFDCSKLIFVNSTGLGVLLALSRNAKDQGKQLILRHVNENVFMLFEIIGALTCLEIED